MLQRDGARERAGGAICRAIRSGPVAVDERPVGAGRHIIADAKSEAGCIEGEWRAAVGAMALLEKGAFSAGGTVKVSHGFKVLISRALKNKVERQKRGAPRATSVIVRIDQSFLVGPSLFVSLQTENCLRFRTEPPGARPDSKYPSGPADPLLPVAQKQKGRAADDGTTACGHVRPRGDVSLFRHGRSLHRARDS